ncbi:Helix-turn-helix domain-containing protein [Streptoalloteichus tenebrarius]|uniref:Helix-turn-helix domain-containing protein n=1 Tax=Streptoalloteichus tenebrarius (strain ATCC 17920 / DSM 40477 / JCM 4838 / CBS 697.72 / NBRC 16177 / NCIMB 11028 / NRRL B-12390 / A12253. 1 / ISP 5477) TaxID=1933 RepID=A0ABT1HNZ5_STRSD|nr:helix-turn-helix transcriptional regulator [Streptoalloteichus tenebrarius]MCP2257239.1 Helix-turn-helix domain-containing protein [Streptoalloteichus tenebrarius]BFE98878.1 helix-turn-helix transcriptional regulator [Streptoalloteichus tenebrarius]
MATPSASGRSLGAQLAQLRKAAGKNVRDAAEYLGCGHPKISKIENGHVGIAYRELLALLDLYGVTDPAHRERLVRLSRQRRQRFWWTPYSDFLSSSFSDYLYLEQTASRLRVFEPLLIPGLLQTPLYAAHQIADLYPVSRDDETMRSLVDVRVRRSQILAQGTRLDAILDEAVLCRPVANARIWRDQLDHLIKMAAEPNVTLRVVPFAAGQYHGGAGRFTVLSFSDLGGDVAYMEGVAGEVTLDAPAEVGLYNTMWDHIETVALSPQETVDLIQEVRDHG